MISLALELAEERLRNKTATAQEIVHFARQGTISARLEREILEQQKELITAKTESLRSSKKVDELYTDAISAMRAYTGDSNRGDDED